MRHILGVDVIPTNNDEILHLFDTSSYSTGLTITCPRLEITIPGFTLPVLLEPAPYFNLALNGIILDLIDPATTELPPLPDGLYHIKYSVSPNDQVYIEFDYLRTATFNRLLYKQRCALNMSACAVSEDIAADLKTLNTIDDYLQAAIGAVEFCDDCDKGVELFVYAKKLLDRYSDQC